MPLRRISAAAASDPAACRGPAARGAEARDCCDHDETGDANDDHDRTVRADDNEHGDETCGHDDETCFDRNVCCPGSTARIDNSVLFFFRADPRELPAAA